MIYKLSFLCFLEEQSWLLGFLVEHSWLSTWNTASTRLEAQGLGGFENTWRDLIGAPAGANKSVFLLAFRVWAGLGESTLYLVKGPREGCCV